MREDPVATGHAIRRTRRRPRGQRSANVVVHQRGREDPVATGHAIRRTRRRPRGQRSANVVVHQRGRERVTRPTRLVHGQLAEEFSGRAHVVVGAGSNHRRVTRPTRLVHGQLAEEFSGRAHVVVGAGSNHRRTSRMAACWRRPWLGAGPGRVNVGGLPGKPASAPRGWRRAGADPGLERVPGGSTSAGCRVNRQAHPGIGNTGNDQYRPYSTSGDVKQGALQPGQRSTPASETPATTNTGLIQPPATSSRAPCNPGSVQHRPINSAAASTRCGHSSPDMFVQPAT